MGEPSPRYRKLVFPVLSSCCPEVDTSSELWAPHQQGPVLSHLELRVLLTTCPQHSRDRRDRAVQ